MIDASTVATSQIIAVVRVADERTSKACISTLEMQMPKENIHIVQEVPFEVALRKCYEIGAKSNVKWMLTIDADILLLPGSIEKLLNEAEKMPEHYVQIEGRIFDKVFGSYRQAGHRIYRTSLLPLALELVPADGEQVRPEYTTLQRLGKRGHPSRRVGVVAGIHDFEQSYTALYRKAYVHGTKHADHANELLKRCKQSAPADPDYRVILQGFCDGSIPSDKVSIDARKFKDRAKRALEYLELEEKPPFEVSSIPDWERWINAQVDFPAPEMLIKDEPSVPVSKGEYFKISIKERGLLTTVRRTLGALLIDTGNLLR